MSIKLKDTIYDLINKASKDSSGNTITSTYLNKTKSETVTGDITLSNSSGTRNLFINGDNTSLRLFAWSEATYIESGNANFSSNIPLKVTGISGSTGSDLYLNFSNIYCRGSNYINIDSGNYSSYAATKDHTHSEYAASNHTHAYLPLSGGSITNSLTGIYINRTSGGYPHITYQKNGTSLGDIGFAVIGSPVFFDYSDTTWKYILTERNWSSYCAPASHTHNYAGSSSAGGPAIYIQDYGTDSSIKIRCGYSGQGLTASTCSFLVGISYDSANKICSYKDISIAEAKILLGVGSYLPLAGGTMSNGARISHGGNLYIGNASNAGWIGCQDICSQNALGDTYWSIRTSGAANFASISIGGQLITFTT